MTTKFDSANVAIWDIHFKELSMREDEGYPSRKLAQYTLMESLTKNLLEYLKDETSYDGERANLSHHDIEIHFYADGKATLRVEVSGMTGNINIDSQISDYSFRNNCSSEFGKFLLSILHEGKLIEEAEYDEIDVEGLN